MFGMGLGGGGTVHNIAVRLDAHVAPYVAKLGQARVATAEFSRQFGRVAMEGDATTKMLGRAALMASGVLVVGMGLAAKAAIDYESAFAGVRKTVDGSDAELGRISDAFRRMSREIPASAAEIAAVGEEAGALGVQRQNIVGFTRTMIDLGETTDMSATVAAEGLARFSNIMGTSQADADRLGSSLVDLGNKLAATESEILEMGLRIAGAGAQVNMTEGDVLGLAGALTSVGINAEAGGSAISRVIADIASNVASGTPKVEQFARIAGYEGPRAAERFAEAWREDPAAALSQFVGGLDNVRESGGNVFGVLERLEFGEIRVRDALLRAAGASDMFSRALEIGNTAWDENVALQEEAEKRYQTTAARIEVAWNNAQDLAIGLGGQLLPAVNSVAGSLRGFVSGLDALPGPAQAATQGLYGVTTAGLGIAGMAGVMGPKIGQAKRWLDGLATTAPTLARGLTFGGAALGGLGIAALLAAPILTDLGNRAAANATQIDLFTQAIIEADGATSAFNVQRQVAEELAGTGLGTALREEGVDAQVWIDAITSGTDALDEFFAQATIGDINTFIDDLEAGRVSAGDFTDDLLRLAEAAENSGNDFALEDWQHDLIGLRDNFEAGADAAENYEYAQEGVNDAAEQGADQYNLFRGALEGGVGSIDGATNATDELSAAQQRLNEGLKSWADPWSAYTDALENKRQAEVEAAESTDTMVENITLSTEEWIAALEFQQAAFDNWQANLGRIAAAGHEDVAAEFAAMGVESAEQVQRFVDSTPGQMRRLARLLRSGADRGTDEFAREIELGLAVAAMAGGTGARLTAGAIANELGIGVDEVRRLAAMYGVELAGGLNPILESLGRREIHLRARTNSGSIGMQGPGTAPSHPGLARQNARGNLLAGTEVAGDTADRHLAEIARAGEWRVWAENETGGEAYIPLANDDRRPRAMGILAEVAKMFGAELTTRARGGYQRAEDVPRPPAMPGFEFYRPGREALDHTYRQAREWVAENARPPLTAGIGWEAMWQAVVGQFPDAQLFSAFRPGAITATGNASYHGKGRAIDISPRMDIFDWLAHNYPWSTELIFSPAGGRQLYKGSPHVYSEPTRGDHWDHIHWALARGGILGPVSSAFGPSRVKAGTYDQGGWLDPGLTLAYNGTGIPERVMAPAPGTSGGWGPVDIKVDLSVPDELGPLARKQMMREVRTVALEAVEDALAGMAPS